MVDSETRQQESLIEKIYEKCEQIFCFLVEICKKQLKIYLSLIE